MNTPDPIESFRPSPLMALSVVDSLARALRVQGEFPPPLGEISCALVAATAPVARTFDPPRKLHTFRNRSGYVITDGTFTIASEPQRRWPLGPGTYRIRVTGEYYQDAEFLMPWPLADGARRITVPQQPPVPSDPGSVQLLPSTNYPVPDVSGSRFQLGPTILRGTALAADGTPHTGIRAEVINLPFLAPVGLPPLGDWPFLAADTNTLGDWTLVLPDRRYFDAAPEIPAAPVIRLLSFQVSYPNSAPVVRQATVQLGSEFALRNTLLRGQVFGPGGRGIADAIITSSVNARASRTRADGSWALCFDLNQVSVPNITVTATTPAGATATAPATLQREATIVVPSFHLP